MDIAALRDFIAVVEAGSLTRAATALHVSQPAISQRMSQLEHDLDVRLLERGPRGIEPTEAGRTLYRDAQHLVRQFDRLATSVGTDQHSVSGPVAVGLPSTVAAQLAPALYSWTKHNYPNVHLQLFESMSGYIQELLLRGRMDLAVLFRDDSAQRPAETPLYAEELYLVGDSRTPFADPEEVSLSALEGVPIVAPGARSNLRTLIERTFAAYGLTPEIVADVESLAAMIHIARSGEACTILPLSSIDPRSEETVGIHRIVEPVIERHVAVCTVAEFFRPRDAVEAVRQGIIEVTASLAGNGAWRGIRLTG